MGHRSYEGVRIPHGVVESSCVPSRDPSRTTRERASSSRPPPTGSGTVNTSPFAVWPGSSVDSVKNLELFPWPDRNYIDEQIRNEPCLDQRVCSHRCGIFHLRVGLVSGIRPKDPGAACAPGVDLHYIAVIVLTRKNSAWGFGAGCIIAAFWNYINLFVTTFVTRLGWNNSRLCFERVNSTDPIC